MYRNRTILIILTVVVIFTTGCTLDPIIPLPTSPISPEQITPQQSDVDNQPPEIRINSSINKSLDNNQVIFRWLGTDNNTPSSQLVYSTFLKDYDRDYSPFTRGINRTYSNLQPGTFTFYVKAKDQQNNVGLAIATIEITPSVEFPEEIITKTPVTNYLVTLPNSEVNQIAASSYSSVIYALDSTNSKLYKSEHTGYSWKDISSSITGTLPWSICAISPSDHNIIAIVTNASSEVYLSIDGGISFSPTDLATKLDLGEKIKCINISPHYGKDNYEIAVGTSTNNGDGKIWINIIGTFSGTWKDISTDIEGWTSTLLAISGVDVFSVQYSPSFAVDGTILAITASGPSTENGNTYLYMGIRDLTTNLIKWNGLPGYPVEICEQGENTPGTPITFAVIAIPSDFISTAINQRQIYVCWVNQLPGLTVTSDKLDNVYRLENNQFYRIGAPDLTCSLAYYGTLQRGKLLAGSLQSNSTLSGINVYSTQNPQSINPTWQRSQKSPSGQHSAQISWSPDGNTAYCGTSTFNGASFDRSAFSISTDNGITWNQIGLIDN